MGHRRHLRAALLAVLGSALLSACGDDPAPIAAGSGPAARWRRAADASGNGRATVIEALRPLTVTFAWIVGGAVEGQEAVSLAPGDAVKIAASAGESRLPGAPAPPEAERAKGRTTPNGYSLRYSLDDAADHQRTEIVWTRPGAIWMRISAAESPPTWMSIPNDREFTLLALAVSDAPDWKDFRLDLSSPARIFSPRPMAPEDVAHVTSLVVSITPR